jgi:hypothetical protein
MTQMQSKQGRFQRGPERLLDGIESGLSSG